MFWIVLVRSRSTVRVRSTRIVRVRVQSTELSVSFTALVASVTPTTSIATFQSTPIQPLLHPTNAQHLFEAEMQIITTPTDDSEVGFSSFRSTQLQLLSHHCLITPSLAPIVTRLSPYLTGPNSHHIFVTTLLQCGPASSAPIPSTTKSTTKSISTCA